MNYSRRSLENLYSGIAGKPVTQRAHLSVFGEETNTPEETREVEVTIENIHKALDNLATDIEDSSELKKLYNRILNFSSYKHIKRSLTDKGYSDLIYKKFSNDVQRLIEDIPAADRSAFLEYIQKPTQQQIRFNNTNHTGNVFNLLAETGISKDTMSRIFQHTGQDEGGRGVGMGELAMALIFGNLGAGGQNKKSAVSAAEKVVASRKAELKAAGQKYGATSTDEALVKASENLKSIKGQAVKGDLELDGAEFEVKGEGASLGARPDAVHKRQSRNTIAYLNSIGVEVSGGRYTYDGQIIGRNLGDFPTVIATIYSRLKSQHERSLFEDNFKQFLATSGEMSAAINTGWDMINIDMTEPYSIQRGVSLLSFLEYAMEEEFKYFMAHDIGKAGKGTGQYVSVGGSPVQMMQALAPTNVGFEKIKASCLRPRIGFQKSYLDKSSPVTAAPVETAVGEEEEEYV